jgi:hypothetical protein
MRFLRSIRVGIRGVPAPPPSTDTSASSSCVMCVSSCKVAYPG